MEKDFKNKVRNIVSEAVRHYLKEEEENLNQYVPKKAFRAVEKINQELQDLKNMTGEEYPSLLDTSTGSESFFDVITPVTIENGRICWKERDPYRDKISDESWNCVSYDEDEGYWFDDYWFKDAIGGLKSGIKKAIKYYNEYNIEWDDDESKHDRFIDNLG
jgi:hypothetical protein